MTCPSVCFPTRPDKPRLPCRSASKRPATCRRRLRCSSSGPFSSPDCGSRPPSRPRRTRCSETPAASCQTASAASAGSRHTDPLKSLAAMPDHRLRHRSVGVRGNFDGTGNVKCDVGAHALGGKGTTSVGRTATHARAVWTSIKTGLSRTPNHFFPSRSHCSKATCMLFGEGPNFWVSPSLGIAEFVF